MTADSGPDRPSPITAGRDGARSLVAWVVTHLRRPGLRSGLLITVGYVTGLAGLALSFKGDPASPDGTYGVVGIGLMAISFTCLFIVSIGLLKRGGGTHTRESGETRRKR